MSGEYSDIEQKQRQKNETPQVVDGDQDGDQDGNSGGSGLPIPSISRRTGLVIGLVVIVGVALYLKSRDGDGDDGGGNSEMEKARDADLSAEVNIRGDEDGEEAELVIPTNPDDELAKDEAILNYFKETGRIEGDD